ncbi:MAG: XTP/dITP diphosphatase [Armatimonadota bacterium]|nr:XTP/dITP diphosphatase [Armatimonadota bacterium]
MTEASTEITVNAREPLLKKLLVATRNPGKAREMAAVLADLPLTIVTLEDYPEAPNVEETGSTFEENAVAKAAAYARFTGLWTIADDSGLEVDALNGAPGVFSSRFAPSDPERIAKLLELMKDVPEHKRTARFRCVIAIASPEGQVETCEDTLEGIIASEPRGSNGFGYDPVLYLPEFGKHVAELSPEQKNAISHRGKALRKAKAVLRKKMGLSENGS